MSPMRIGLRLMFVIWCLVVLVRFSGVVVKEIATPFNGGADWLWVAAWIATCIFFVVVFALVPKKVALSISLIPALAAIVVIFLSHSWLPVFLALWLVSLCAAIGCIVLQKITGDNSGGVECLVCGISIGIGAISLVMTLFGISGLLTATSIRVFLVIVSIAVLLVFARRRLTLPAAGFLENESRLIYAITGSMFFVYLLWAIAPEIQYDALNYHLSVPARYLQIARIVEMPFYHAYLARLMELFLTACLAVGGSATAKVWVFVISIAATVAVYALGRRSFDSRVGIWAAALFATTPLVGWLSGTGYIDNILALIVTSSFIALVRWEDSEKQGWLYAAALLAGIAVGSKVNTVFVYVVVAPIVAVQVLTEKSMDFPRRMRIFLTALFAGGVFAAPSYLLTYTFTGNPVFPFLNAIFKSPKWSPDNTIMNASDYGLPMTLSSLIRFPFRLTFDTIRFGDASPRGSIGVALLLAFPFSWFLIPRLRLGGRLLVGGATVYLLLLFYTMQYARYYIMILPLVAVIAVATVLDFTPVRLSRWLPAALLVLIIVQPLVYSLQFWNIPERIPIALAAGREDTEGFLHRALPGYGAAEYLNTVTNPGDTILGVGTENLRFYLRAELRTRSLSLADDPLRSLSAMKPGDALAGQLERAGIRYLFVTRASTTNPSGELPYIDKRFLESHALPMFTDEFAAVYRLLANRTP